MTTAYAVQQAGGPFGPIEVARGPLGALEVDVDVTHCGVCQTDVGIVDAHYGQGQQFPAVAGHEAVGTVRTVGELVDTSRVAPGMRVGIGAISGSCFACEYCLSGRQQLCAHRDDTVLRGTGGGFASSLRASDWRHAHPIPDAISSAAAGPLMCAGTTVFAPILRNGILATHRVAVVGVGGLGHLAIQFLAAWGCEVTAISSTASKAADALGFGAHDVVNTADGGLDAAHGRFDFIISTVPVNLPWNDYIAGLRPQGRLILLGMFPGSIEIDMYALMPHEKQVVGGIPGSAEETKAMLRFAALHGVTPQLELFPVARIDEAVERVRGGQARYRVVLEM